MTKLMLIAGFLASSSCADGTAAPAPSEDVARTLAATELVTARTPLMLPATVDQVFDARRHLTALGADICDLQPQDSPCALACDPDVLSTFVPEGGCALFQCETPNGDPIKVGECNQP